MNLSGLLASFITSETLIFPYIKKNLKPLKLQCNVSNHLKNAKSPSPQPSRLHTCKGVYSIKWRRINPLKNNVLKDFSKLWLSFNKNTILITLEGIISTAGVGSLKSFSRPTEDSSLVVVSVGKNPSKHWERSQGVRIAIVSKRKNKSKIYTEAARTEDQFSLQSDSKLG